MNRNFARNVGFNYFFEFVKNVNLMSAFWPIFLVTKGMTLIEVGLLESIFHITSLIMETPTGAIADIYGRLFSRRLGIITHMIYMIIFLFIGNFTLAAIGFVFAALGYNLESGSGTAFVYDSLKEINEEERFAKVEARRELVLNAAQVSGALLGGIAAIVSFELSYSITLGLSLIALLLTFFMKETPLPEQKTNPNFMTAIYQQLTVAGEVIRKDPWMHHVMIFSAWIAAIGTTIYFYTTTYWHSIGWNETTVGYGIAIASLLGAIIALITPKWVKQYNHSHVIINSSLILVLSVLLMFDAWWAIAGLVMIAASESILYISSNAFFNERIESTKRATLLSYSSMLFSLVMIVLFPLVGALIEWWSFQIVSGVLSLLGLATSISFILSTRKNRKT